VRSKVLIIDDEANLRKIVQELLERAGFEVFSFEGFAEAKPILNTEDIDVVLTDLQMPEFSGMDVLEYCQNYTPDLPEHLILF
jgi:DNA-binding NtrC family response regulator